MLPAASEGRREKSTCGPPPSFGEANKFSQEGTQAGPERAPLAVQVGRASPDQFFDGPEAVGGQDRRSKRDVPRFTSRGQRLQTLNKMW